MVATRAASSSNKRGPDGHHSVALRSPDGAGGPHAAHAVHMPMHMHASPATPSRRGQHHQHQHQHQLKAIPLSPAPSSTSSSSSSSSSASAAGSAPSASPRVSLARALSCRHCGKGETWRLHDLPAETLAYSRWSDSSNWGYLIFRGLLAIYWAFVTVLAGTVTAKGVKVPEGFAFNNQYGATYFLYVTYWSCLLQCVYLILAFLTALFPRQRALYRTTWVLRTITAPAACLVAMLYWTLIFPSTGVTDYADASIHGSNALIMLADVAVSRLPLYARHFYMPFLYTFVYAVFNGVYVGAGGKDSHGEHHIYEVLSYKPLGQSLLLLGAVLFVALPCLYALLWLETRVCLYLSGALTTVQPDHEPLTPEPLQQQQSEEQTQSSSSSVSSVGDEMVMMSPGAMKLVEAEMGGQQGVGGMHHRPPHHAVGAVKAS